MRSILWTGVDVVIWMGVACWLGFDPAEKHRSWGDFWLPSFLGILPNQTHSHQRYRPEAHTGTCKCVSLSWHMGILNVGSGRCGGISSDVWNGTARAIQQCVPGSWSQLQAECELAPSPSDFGRLVILLSKHVFLALNISFRLGQGLQAHLETISSDLCFFITHGWCRGGGILSDRPPHVHTVAAIVPGWWHEGSTVTDSLSWEHL